jgi:hypothetical protein
MADDKDPWEQTKKLIGDDFFDVAQPSAEQVREAFENELERSHDAGEQFSVLRMLASLPGSGFSELRPGAYFAGDPQSARRQLADHDGFKTEQTPGGGWVSGSC